MNFISLLSATVRLAAPTILIALGGMFCLKINLFNLGLEGFLLMASFSAVAGAYVSDNIPAGAVLAVLTGVVFMLLYGVFTLELRVDPVVGGIAVISIATGLTRFLLLALFGQNGRLELLPGRDLAVIELPLIEDIPYLSEILSGHSLIVYLAFLLPFFLHYMFYHTAFGLALRSIGENANVAEAAGINTKRIKYLALLLAGVLAGLAGAQLSLSTSLFNVGMSNGRGYTAIAALIMARSQPLPTFLACVLFGFADALVIMVSGYGLPSQFLSMFPYVLAILVAVIPSMIRRGKRQIQLKRFNHSGIFVSSHQS